jgi:uncharacterized protein with FMN-binding domain
VRRITLWLLSTLAAVVLLFSYRTSLGAAAPAGTTAEGTTTDPATAATDDSSSTTSSGAITSGSSTSGSATYKGSVASTRWGDVQVSITVADGKITAVSVPVYPNSNGKDQQINARALPILTQETIAAQSADIDTVSGATITSDGYIESLQAALDAAHLS